MILSGIFKNTTSDLSRKYPLEITPAGWTFSIWGIIYTWQGLWLVYGLSTICRRVNNGPYIYMLPIMSPFIYLVYTFTNVFNVAWLFAFDRQELIWALVTIAMIPFTLGICMFLSFKNLYERLAFLNKQGASKEVWFIRLLVQNGLAIYATWTNVATLINLAMVMTYRGSLSVEDASTVALGILTFEILLWVLLENLVFDKYVRYTFSPYITLVMALSGVVAKNFDLEMTERNSIFSLALLVAAVFLLIMKLIIMIYRHFKQPIIPSSEYEPTI